MRTNIPIKREYFFNSFCMIILGVIHYDLVVLHLNNLSQMSIKFIFFSRKNPLHILVALDNDDDKGGQAEGELFWDDGDSIGIVVFCLLC